MDGAQAPGGPATAVLPLHTVDVVSIVTAARYGVHAPAAGANALSANDTTAGAGTAL